MRYEAQHKGKGRWQVWDHELGEKRSESWLNREEAYDLANLGNEASSIKFQEEGADVAEVTKLTVTARPQRPNAPDLGKEIVDFVLAQYDHWDPCDWQMVLTSMKYAERMGKYWGDSTRNG